MLKLPASFAATALLLLPLSVVAMPDNTTSEEVGSSQEMERIQVQHDWFISKYRKDAKKAEKAFYKLYNELTPDKKLQFECVKKLIGMAVTKRVCQPKYLTRLHHSYDMHTIQDAIHGIQPPERLRELENYKKRHTEHITNLVSNNPELFKKLANFKAANDLYQKKKKEYKESFSLFGDD